jgi:glycerol-3-phosphate acyltransferase
VARAILPKFYMERLNAQVYDHLWLPATRKVAVTSAPRVMAEWFLKEYMAADVVVGCELQIVKVGGRCYFTGLLCEPDQGTSALKELFRTDGAMADVGVVRSSNPLDHFFLRYCKVLPLFHSNRRYSFNTRQMNYIFSIKGALLRNTRPLHN